MTRHERFMAKVNVNNGSDCWLWTGSQGGSGYGQFWDGNKNIQAHWFLLDKKPENGKEACHTCDNKLCVRPSHIFIGSRSDNMLDCSAKGRLRYQNGIAAAKGKRKTWHRGINNHESKLTEEQAYQAKNCPRKYGAASALARRFGVSVTDICHIRNGRRWTHLK